MCACTMAVLYTTHASCSFSDWVEWLVAEFADTIYSDFRNILFYVKVTNNIVCVITRNITYFKTFESGNT